MNRCNILSAHPSTKSFRLGANYAFSSFIKAVVSLPTPKARDSRPGTSGHFTLKGCCISEVYRKRGFSFINSHEPVLTTLDENIKIRGKRHHADAKAEGADGAGCCTLSPSFQFTGEETVRHVFPPQEANGSRRCQMAWF